MEEDGLTSKNAKVGVLAFKTDVFDRADESIFRISTDASTPISSPYAVIVVLEHHDSAVASATGGSSASLGASTSPTSPPPSPPAEFTQADEDDNTVISKEEFADYARSRSEYSDVFVVISDEFWDIFDADGTNSLSMTEFMSAVSAFDQGYMYGMPWLEYSLGETEYLTDFYVETYLPCEAEVDEDGYYLVFKHDSSTGQYWSNANDDAESKHTGSNPETDYKYSRLDDVEEFGRTDEGFLQFKLEYPTLSQTNIWKQTSNPVTASGRGVDGFEAISVEANGHGTSTHSFKGLEHNSGSSNFIDGTVDHGNWFFSIGAYKAWGGANNFPGPSSGVNQVKLWVKTSAKKPDTCPSPPPPPSTYSSYEILEGDVTCESKGWVTILDIDECQVAGATLSGDSNKGFRYDQPEGGYTTSSSSRTRGCTFHSGNVNNDLQFFPNAVGACGTYNFDCVCGVK